MPNAREIGKIAPDEKETASLTMHDVIRQTINNFPESQYRPRVHRDTENYTIADIDPFPYGFFPTADGIGTKPELAERLYDESVQQGIADPSVYSSLAFDTLAMIDGDEARFGRFLVGVTQVLDLNTAKNQSIVQALASGVKQACDEGHFALLNGETAELGYRTSGYGDTRVNWNATGISIVVPDKLLLGDNLSPGQPVVALREKSIRSNGLSKARTIIEAAYLQNIGFESKEEFIADWFAKRGFTADINELRELFGHDPIEQVLLPWHKMFPEITRQLKTQSQLYGPLIYQAQGGIMGEKKVKMVAAAHNTGGSVPEKAKRMLKAKKLGLHLDPVFPDPEGVTSLLRTANTLPENVRNRINIDDRTACEQWNRGVGFLIVTENEKEAKKLIQLAEQNDQEAAKAGEIIDKPEIIWRGHKWTY